MADVASLYKLLVGTTLNVLGVRRDQFKSKRSEHGRVIVLQVLLGKTLYSHSLSLDPGI